MLIEPDTVLAPTNEAFAKHFNSTNDANNTELEALLSYHVLRGSFTREHFNNNPQFIPTLLSDSRYASVTGGQRVEVALSGSGITFYSAVKAASNLITAVRFKLSPGP